MPAHAPASHGCAAWRPCGRRGGAPPARALGGPECHPRGSLIVWASDASAGDLVALLLRACDAGELRALLFGPKCVAVRLAGVVRAWDNAVRAWDNAEGSAEKAVGVAVALEKEARPGKLPMLASSPLTPALDADSLAGRWRRQGVLVLGAWGLQCCVG